MKKDHPYYEYRFRPLYVMDNSEYRDYKIKQLQKLENVTKNEYSIKSWKIKEDINYSELLNKFESYPKGMSDIIFKKDSLLIQIDEYKMYLVNTTDKNRRVYYNIAEKIMKYDKDKIVTVDLENENGYFHI